MAASTGGLSTGSLVGAGISLLPALYKGISGIFQKSQANRINPSNPGYVMNNNVINNARVLSDRSNNYQLAGYDGAVDNITSTSANAFNNGVQGATSGGDVLDLATKIAYGQGQRMNDLAVANAQGKDQALIQSLNADAAAGEEYQQKNAYDRDIYQQKLREKAALIQSANQNIYGGIDDAAQIGSSLINPMPTGTSSTTGNPTQARTSMSTGFNSPMPDVSAQQQLYQAALNEEAMRKARLNINKAKLGRTGGVIA